MKHNLFCFLFFILVHLFYYAPNTIASPIINGIPDDRHRFKFHVSIHNREGSRNEYKHACSGNIISERYILTAAHCFMGILDGVIERVIYPRGTTKIIAGTNLRDGPGIERDLIKVFIPAEYDVHINHHAEILVAEADIAVGELSADLGVHQHPDRLAIIPMEVLDPHSNAGVNERAKFCGFGYDILIQHAGQFHPGESNNNINKFMDVKILGRDECPQFNTDICARNSDKRTFRTACYGDSGAGLVYGNKIVGVHSSGPAQCNTIEPIVFTRLYGFMRFIEEAQNPDGDHSNMMILDAKPARRRPQAGSSSSSTKDKKRKIELKAKNAQH